MIIENRHILKKIDSKLAFIITSTAANVRANGNVSLSLPYKQQGYLDRSSKFVVINAPSSFMGALVVQLQAVEYQDLEIKENTLAYKGFELVHEKVATAAKIEAVQVEEKAKAQDVEEAEIAPKPKRTRKNKDNE